MLALNHKKPLINLSLPALCSFRSGKAYLWALVRDRLFSLQQLSDSPLHILDAACHVLNSRPMFPTQSFYYGLDISKNRLKSALSLRHDSDVLYLGDLTRPIPLQSSFNCVVSCNTMCHLPSDQQLLALNSLVECCVHGGDLFVTLPLAFGLAEVMAYLIPRFTSVEPIYFESFLSIDDELNGSVTSDNIISKISANEIAVPNDGSVHRQVLLHAHARLQGFNNVGNAPRPSPISKIVSVNTIPDTELCKYTDDLTALSMISDEDNIQVFFTTFLFDSDVGIKLRESSVLNIYEMTTRIHLNSGVQKIYIFGLERGWTDDSLDRIAINILREIDRLAVRFVLVSSRSGSPCYPSNLALDC